MVKRQIPYLHGQQRADGSTAWHWKPSPRLRRAGWTNRFLGIEEGPAILAAIELNARLAEWENGAAAIAEAPAQPKKYRFTDLVVAYKASTEWADLAPASQREYKVRLDQLELWAADTAGVVGMLPIRAIDQAMVRDLRDTMLEAGASKFKVASLLRVMRLLCNWAVGRQLLDKNPVDRVRIPAPPSRAEIMLPAHADRVAEAAEKLEFPRLALAFPVALWSLQRQADLLALNKMAWRALENVDPADAAVLANRKGDVMGFRLRQAKTGAWIDAPMPPFLHAPIEAAFKAGQWLLPDDRQLGRACPQFLFQRRARAALEAAGLGEFQFRDLRRSGMCMYRDLGVGDSLITAISGHAILGRKTILDTYMPANTRAAAAAVATAIRALARRAEKEKAE